MNTSRPLAFTFALSFVSASLLACSSSSDNPPADPGRADTGITADADAALPTTRSTFVLVHGAWMGAWCWDDVALGLRARGATVSVVDLPAHGDDPATPATVTLDGYVAKVGAAIDASATPVVLVGHSMGGVVITQTAETRPDKIARLVYLTAFVPQSGQSMLDLATTDTESSTGKYAKIDPVAGTVDLPKDALKEVFCADCSDAALAKLIAHYRIEPAGPLSTPVKTTAEGWGRVSKTYVYATLDQAISYGFQQKMTAGVTFASTAKLETSHAAMLSRPEQLVALLAAF